MAASYPGPAIVVKAEMKRISDTPAPPGESGMIVTHNTRA